MENVGTGEDVAEGMRSGTRWFARRHTVRQRLADAGETVVAISPLVAPECAVGPLSSANLALRYHYLHAFESFRVLDLGLET